MACFLFLLGDFATWRELMDSIEDQFAQASIKLFLDLVRFR